jgi:hypothetical protein
MLNLRQIPNYMCILQVREGKSCINLMGVGGRKGPRVVGWKVRYTNVLLVYSEFVIQCSMCPRQ